MTQPSLQYSHNEEKAALEALLEDSHERAALREQDFEKARLQQLEAAQALQAELEGLQAKMSGLEANLGNSVIPKQPHTIDNLDLMAFTQEILLPSKALKFSLLWETGFQILLFCKTYSSESIHLYLGCNAQILLTS